MGEDDNTDPRRDDNAASLRKRFPHRGLKILTVLALGLIDYAFGVLGCQVASQHMRQSGRSGSFDPHEEEVRQVCIWDGVVVRRVRDECGDAVVRQKGYGRRSSFDVAGGKPPCLPVKDTTDVVDGDPEVPDGVSRPGGLSEVPGHLDALPNSTV